MPSKADQDWVEKYIAAKLEKLREGNERTRQQLRKSVAQIALSEELLKMPVPKVWPPKPPPRH
jgi:hypothetical protein